MPALDAYALTYLGALIVTGALSFALGGCARRKGALLLGAAWVATIAIQTGEGVLAAPGYYALLDFALVAVFGVIGLLYNRVWAWWVSGFHVAMMLAHLAYSVIKPDDPFVYPSVLAGLGYASMAAIALPPVITRLRGGADEAMDYRAFMRGGDLPASAFLAGDEKTRKGAGP